MAESNTTNRIDGTNKIWKSGNFVLPVASEYLDRYCGRRGKQRREGLVSGIRRLYPLKPDGAAGAQSTDRNSGNNTAAAKCEI